MSEQMPAARDTTFDNVIPNKIWISTRSTSDRKYIKVYVEINGIEKEIESIYVGHYDGIHSSSTQLTWVINSACDPLRKDLTIAVDALKQIREALTKIESK